MEDAVEQPPQAKRQKSEAEKWAIVTYTLQHYDMASQRLAYGAGSTLEARYGLNSRAIRDIVKEYLLQIEGGLVYPDLKPSIRSHSGVARMYYGDQFDGGL